MLVVAVLGPVAVSRDGVPLTLPGGKTTEVLIRLALDAGKPVRASRLIEDLWGGEVVSANVLQAKVSKLRRVLGDPALVTSDANGYTLHVDPAAVDALEVLRGGGLFGGAEILPDAGDGEWLGPWRARLAEARLRLTEEHFAARLDGGESGALVGELESLVAEHPLREGLWRQLITALYRDGRQGDALAAYRRARSLLADELGVDPGSALRDLERLILVQDAALAPGNLPPLAASLIGRDAEVAAVSDLVAGERLVTVVGPAGVGKTRLALSVAAGSGGWLVRLESAGADLWRAVGEAFSIAEATEAMVLDRLRGLHTLVLLDNCEHVVELVVPVIARILGAAPGVRLLATSQVPLRIDGEIVHVLEPLPPDAAAALFRERASRHRRIAPDEDVAGVVRQLDGLPLAIELAAARAKALPVPEIARRLGDRFTLLADPNSRRPARRRTLRAAIGWSYDLLFPDDQHGLWALATCAGGASLDAAERVMAALGVPAATALDVLDRLVDRSLAIADVNGDGVRYRLLDSVRAYGRERSEAVGVASRAHAEWFGEAAARAAEGLRGGEQARHLAFVRTERADIDAALAWAKANDPGLALRIVNGFGWAWIFLGAGADAARRSREVLAAAVAAPAEDRVDALLFAAWFEASGGDLDRAFADVRAAREIAPLPRTRLFLAFLHSQQGRPVEALKALDEFEGTEWEAGTARLLEAWARTGLGETAAARDACDEALRILTPLGDAWALSHAEALLGGLAQAEHRYGAAVAHLTRAADAAHRLGFAAAEALHLANLGRAQQQSGAPSSALATLDRAAATAETVGEQRGAAFARTRRARVLRQLGRLDECRAELARARRFYEAAGGDGDLLSAQLAASLDDDRPGLERVLAAAREAGDHEVELLTLDALARIQAAAGDEQTAAGLRAAAEALLPVVGHQIVPADRVDLAR